jgi:hypothetical protein
MNDVITLSTPSVPTDTKIQPDVNQPPKWRKLFKSVGEMDSSPLKFPIANFLPEGITFFGALPASGKTWLCLSMAKAISTGQRFLETMDVIEPSNVLYLIPESGERSFRQRLESMDIPDNEHFLCRTMSDGPIRLNNDNLLAAVTDLRPIVFLDTAVRFNLAENENDASQSHKYMADMIFGLINRGAKAVVCAHHSTKAVKKEVTLESCLRGSGDLAAMADAVYYLQVTDASNLRFKVRNVKARDFEPVKPFEVEGRPYIDLTGDFHLVNPIDEPHFTKQERERQEGFLAAIATDPDATFTKLELTLDIPRKTLQRIAAKAGWAKGNGTPWSRLSDGETEESAAA